MARLAAASLPILPLATPLLAQTGDRPRNRDPRPSAFTLSAGIVAASGRLGGLIQNTERGRLAGRSDAGPHLALGAASPWTGTAVEVRVEAFYNQRRGPENSALARGPDQPTARFSTRDRAFGAGPVVLWRARPGHAIGPYELTGAAVSHTRLSSAGTRDDPRSSRARVAAG